ncbi:hypothetical protein, partial [Lysinibacillus sp. NPDC093688]|uniref:hypothetical protein n=1 Tax=Lysinibacillus sp. NPDC093688 TaxID=3390577 RepID=UPI003D072DE5
SFRLGDSLGISDRGTKAKSITSCDNAFVTNIGAAAATLHCAFAQKTFVAPTPRKAPSRNGNQPYVMVKSRF